MAAAGEARGRPGAPQGAVGGNGREHIRRALVPEGSDKHVPQGACSPSPEKAAVCACPAGLLTMGHPNTMPDWRDNCRSHPQQGAR